VDRYLGTIFIPDRYQRYSRFLEYWYQDGGMSHYLRLLCDALVFYGRADEAVPLLLNSFATAGSGGQLWMDFEFRPIDSVLTGEIPADVVPEKLEPFPFDEMLDLYEDYDG
jgi:hypothetical protein